MTAIQSKFRVSQQIGQVGAPSRPNQSLGEKILKVALLGVGLIPGDAFTIDGNGEIIQPADATAALSAVGVVSFSQGDINSAITQVENHKTGVVYAEDDLAPCVTDGNIFVLAGGAILAGDGVNFDPADGKWTAGGTSTKAAFIADDAGADGDIISIQVNRIA